MRRLATVDAVEGGGVIKLTLSLDARGTAVQGAFAGMELQDGSKWLVRIGGVTMSNPIHSNDQFAPIIMSRGSVPEWSGITDIERAEAEVVSIIDEEGEQTPRRINPPSGTHVIELSDGMIERFQRERKHFAAVGKVANSNNAVATVINRNFGPWESGGYGEARHMLIVGKNGSGKSVWVLINLVTKIAAHPEMGFLIPDTQGDFSNPTKHNRGEFKWNFVETLNEAGVHCKIIDINDVALKSKAVLKALLKPCFVRSYAISGEKSDTLVGRVVEGMFDSDVCADDLTAVRVANEVLAQIGYVYAKSSRQEKIDDAQNVIDNPGRLRILDDDLRRSVRPYFEGANDVRDIVRGVLTRSEKIILRMEGQTDRHQMNVMDELLSMLKREAQKIYKSNSPVPANAIVLLDEAARWAPEGGDPPIKETVLQAVRETRKAGVGWWFVGQSPADISKTIMRQAHMMWFGRGLGVGVDEEHLRRALGEQGMATYNELQRHPGRFFWIGTGLDANVGHDNTYIAVTPFCGDSTKALIEANPHIWTKARSL